MMKKILVTFISISSFFVSLECSAMKRLLETEEIENPNKKARIVQETISDLSFEAHTLLKRVNSIFEEISKMKPKEKAERDLVADADFAAKQIYLMYFQMPLDIWIIVAKFVGFENKETILSIRLVNKDFCSCFKEACASWLAGQAWINFNDKSQRAALLLSSEKLSILKLRSYDQFFVANVLPTLTNLTLLDANTKFKIPAIQADSLIKLSKLTSLKLDAEGLESQVIVSSLVNLTELDIRAHNINKVLGDLNRINTCMTSLCIRDLGSEFLDEALETLTQLTYLDINSDTSGFNGSCFSCLGNLTSLYVRECDPDEIGDGFDHLSNLKHLHIEDCTSISDKMIKGLTGLRSLELTFDNGITDEGIRGMTKLENLLTNNHISNSLIMGLPNLVSLGLWDVETMTDDLLRQMTNLTSLDLRHNSTISIEGIRNLTKVTTLWSYDNQNDTLFSGEAIAGLTHLRDIKYIE